MQLNIKALSINKAFQGRRFKTADYKEYEDSIGKLLLGHKRNHFEDTPKMVEVHYHFYLKNYKRTDVGNLEKPLTDILVANGYLPDDRFIKKIVLEKYPNPVDYIIIDII